MSTLVLDFARVCSNGNKNMNALQVRREYRKSAFSCTVVTLLASLLARLRCAHEIRNRRWPYTPRTSPALVDIIQCIYSRYRYICLWTSSWRQFQSDCNHTSSVIPFATGDEVIKFCEVAVKGQGRWKGICALLNALLVVHCFIKFVKR